MLIEQSPGEGLVGSRLSGGVVIQNGERQVIDGGILLFEQGFQQHLARHLTALQHPLQVRSIFGCDLEHRGDFTSSAGVAGESDRQQDKRL